MIKYDIKKINHKNIRMIPKKMESFADSLNKTIVKVKDRVSKEVPDKGFFRNFAEDFENNNNNIFAKAISLSVERDENIEGNVLLILSALHPSMNLDASSMLICGKRDDLLKFMNQENFSQFILKEINKLSDSLKKI